MHESATSSILLHKAVSHNDVYENLPEHQIQNKAMCIVIIAGIRISTASYQPIFLVYDNNNNAINILIICTYYLLVLII